MKLYPRVSKPSLSHLSEKVIRPSQCWWPLLIRDDGTYVWTFCNKHRVLLFWNVTLPNDTCHRIWTSTSTTTGFTIGAGFLYTSGSFEIIPVLLGFCCSVPMLFTYFMFGRLLFYIVVFNVMPWIFSLLMTYEFDQFPSRCLHV